MSLETIRSNFFFNTYKQFNGPLDRFIVKFVNKYKLGESVDFDQFRKTEFYQTIDDLVKESASKEVRKVENGTEYDHVNIVEKIAESAMIHGFKDQVMALGHFRHPEYYNLQDDVEMLSLLTIAAAADVVLTPIAFFSAAKQSFGNLLSYVWDTGITLLPNISKIPVNELVDDTVKFFLGLGLAGVLALPYVYKKGKEKFEYVKEDITRINERVQQLNEYIPGTKVRLGELWLTMFKMHDAPEGSYWRLPDEDMDLERFLSKPEYAPAGEMAKYVLNLVNHSTIRKRLFGYGQEVIEYIDGIENLDSFLDTYGDEPCDHSGEMPNSERIALKLKIMLTYEATKKPRMVSDKLQYQPPVKDIESIDLSSPKNKSLLGNMLKEIEDDSIEGLNRLIPNMDINDEENNLLYVIGIYTEMNFEARETALFLKVCDHISNLRHPKSVGQVFKYTASKRWNIFDHISNYRLVNRISGYKLAPLLVTGDDAIDDALSFQKVRSVKQEL